MQPEQEKSHWPRVRLMPRVQRDNPQDGVLRHSRRQAVDNTMTMVPALLGFTLRLQSGTKEEPFVARARNWPTN